MLEKINYEFVNADGETVRDACPIQQILLTAAVEFMNGAEAAKNEPKFYNYRARRLALAAALAAAADELTEAQINAKNEVNA